jgi:hypothetical protein
VIVMVVAGQEQEIDVRWGYSRQTENQAPRTQYQSDIKIASGEHGGDP